MAKKKTVSAPKRESLLVELLTEELPPASLRRLSESFARGIFEGLKAEHLLSERSAAEPFATPRRLAVRVSAVLGKQPDRVLERKGPSVQAGLDADGQPTRALLGFARSCGADVATLKRRRDDKGEYFLYQMKQKGEPLAHHLAAVVEASLKKLPVAKLMRWGAREIQFVRPVHGVVLLHGARVVPGTVLGVKSGNKTLGHRFLSKGAVAIKRATDYEQTLRARGHVIASFEERRDRIEKAIKSFEKSNEVWVLGDAERAAGGRMIGAAGDDLLDEVTAIVEYPVVLQGNFGSDFLDVPVECLALSMKQHQRYFPVFAAASGELTNRFLMVSNIKPGRPDNVGPGNERVLRARLADAKFFYNQDRKHRLEDRVPRLAGVVYHSKLGSQLDRVKRLERLAGHIARLLSADVGAAEKAAHLSKADLLTEMVGEFPELQGVMGRYYALEIDRVAPVVAGAIEQHYWPRSAGGELPREPVAVCVALADKLDALVGIFGIGLSPTGEKDPFGLRRAAVGVLRMLVEKSLPLDISALFAQARRQFTAASIKESVDRELQDFFYDRLRSYLREKDYAADEIDAVLALRPARLDQVLPRLEAIRKFRAAPEGQALAAANKRIQNILRQAGDGDPERIAPAIESALFQEEAEKELARQLGEVAERVHPLTAAGDYAAALKELSRLRAAVDAFFDRVMVMVEDENLRTARLQLLAEIRREFREIADVSRLQG